MKRCLIALLALGFASAPMIKAANPVVVMKTSEGTIKIELFEDKAPITVKNFLKYVDDKHYDGTVFHRVIKTFMIQGGGYTKDLGKAKDADGVKSAEKKTRDPIKNESDNGLSNKIGTLAMARTPKADSATSQFFINVSEKNDFLDKANARDGVGYCVFGKVIAGMDVVNKIKDVKTRELFDGFGDVPETDVVIESVKRESK
jgi:cyclophilin family peptidyl-prolyl cis-trans isomerase